VFLAKSLLASPSAKDGARPSERAVRTYDEYVCVVIVVVALVTTIRTINHPPHSIRHVYLGYRLPSLLTFSFALLSAACASIPRT
jgi:hypothetical protein